MNKLPPKLQVVEFNAAFNESIDELPDSVHTLKTGNPNAINKLPSSLTNFKHCSYTSNIMCPLPPSLKLLDLSGGSDDPDKPINFSSLTSLTRLMIIGTWDVPPCLENLPPSLLTLEIFGPFKGTLDSLPPNLTELIINFEGFDQPLDHLPPSLCHLIIGPRTAFAHPLLNLPPSLTQLSVLSPSFTCEPDLRNTGITELDFGKSFNQSVDKLPPTHASPAPRGLQLFG